MKITEVEYAADIRSLKQHLNVNGSEKIGDVEGMSVYVMGLGNGSCYFLYDQLTEAYLSYVAVDREVTDGYAHLRQLENIAGIKGSLSTLMFFLTKKKNMKFVITDEEPLTNAGLNWIVNTIKSGRKLFMFKDQNGNMIDLDSLSKEWENSRIDPDYNGKISIFIETIVGNQFAGIFETKRNGILMPMYRIFKDSSLD